MSSWPLISDFSRVLHNPQIAFRAPELKSCSVEMNQTGQPKARSGNFATVYRGFRPDGGEFAIRVFNRRQDERIEHYRTISQYLEHRTVSSIVDFEYDERGIRSAGDGKMYPLLTMHWVPGITLFEWTRARCHEGYVEALQIAADVWLHLVRELQAGGIVHGDLQHGNVMVSPEGHFQLVDYDCMCVPELIGRRNLEIGLPPYQHPGRDANTKLFAGLDNFSSLVIYVALRALAAAPHLWTTYVDQPGYDRMLFRTQDFEHPANSPLYRELLNSPDDQVRDLTHYLFELVKFNLHDVPPVDEVLLWCESIGSLVGAREWDKVVQLVDRMGPGEQVAPQDQPLVHEAQQRVACRQAMEEALAEGNEERVEQLFATGLLHDYPAASHLLEPAGRAAEVRPILRVLDSALQLRAWDKLKVTWRANQHLLHGRASAKPYEREIQKLLTVDRLRELLAVQPLDDRALVEAWEYLQKLGGHPLAESFRSRVEQCVARHQGLAKLQELLVHAPKKPTLAHDKRIVAALASETVAALDAASPLVKQYLGAQRRIHHVQRVHEVEREGTVESETYIANVMRQLPKSYHEGLAKRSQQAEKRLYIYRQLERLVEDGSSEQDIVQAWDKLSRVRGCVLANDAMRQRVELAEARLPRLRQLREISATADPEERERRILEIWDPAIMEGCVEASQWSDVYARAGDRRQLFSVLEQAVADARLEDAERLLDDPRLQGQALPPDLAKQIHDLRTETHQAALAKRQAIVNSLLDHQRGTFVELFDAAVVADICSQFRHHQPVVNQWLEAEILPVSRIGFSADPEHAIQRDDAGRLEIRWTWPPSNVTNRCHVRICRKPPAPHAIPDDVTSVYSATIDRDQWDAEHGHQVEMDASWEQCRVYVWAEVDLGYQVFYSEPFLVGEIKPLAKQRRWNLFGRGRKAETAEHPAEASEESPEEAAPDAATSETDGANPTESDPPAED